MEVLRESVDGAVRALVGGGPLPVAEARSLVTADRDILDDRFKLLAFFSSLCSLSGCRRKASLRLSFMVFRYSCHLALATQLFLFFFGSDDV